MAEILKRLFFAFEILAPWPEKLPKGRLLDEDQRHLTLAFLGTSDYGKMTEAIKRFPYPPFRVGPAGYFNELVLLPPHHPRVAAWHVEWLDDPIPIELYRESLTAWLQNEGFDPDIREKFLWHATLCRAPFHPGDWRKAFSKIPLIVKALHLYESLGNSKYAPLWTYHFHLPFEEYEHTADIAFMIKGESLEEIKRHALTALAFKCPEMLSYRTTQRSIETIEEVIIDLNESIALADQSIGSPFKAVSFHGDLREEDGILEWEMIVDV